MVWDDNIKLDYILDKQNAFAWPLEYFKEKSEDVIFKVSCDESALSKRVDTLDAVADEPLPPKSAYTKFDGNAFVIEPEVYGTALDSEKLKEKVQECALKLEGTLDLQKEGFYEKPQYTTESEELVQACKKLNDLCRASITYEMDVPVVVDKTLISTWLSVDEKFNVILDENAVRNWILEFDARYDTLGATRPLTTPAGKAAEVSGGTYGWSINEHEEFAALLNSIRNGEVLTRTPSYVQTAASHAPQDWGSTFLEVDLTAQHMWYVRDGAVAFESDVVTGSVPNGTDTPPGVYTILEKLSPTVLVGNINPATGKPEYRTPVTFWMRVTYSGIGFHDATWQPAFGGDVYLWNGSHGCINMPYYGAQEPLLPDRSRGACGYSLLNILFFQKSFYPKKRPPAMWKIMACGCRGYASLNPSPTTSFDSMITIKHLGSTSFTIFRIEYICLLLQAHMTTSLSAPV